MAESHLLEVLGKLSATKETKTLIKSLFDKLLKKTTDAVKKKFLDQSKHKAQKIRSKSSEAVPTNKYVPISQNREENFMDFKQKEEESRDFVKKLKQEQKERERRQQEREEEERERIKQEEKQRERQNHEIHRKAEHEKAQRLHILKEKSKKRKEEIKDLIENGNIEYKKVVSTKPLHEKIEEQYYSKVLMPELERHKQELAKKRELLQPINRSAIIEHARRHDQQIEEHYLQKQNISQDSSYDSSRLRSKFTVAYLEEKKKKKQEDEKESLMKKHLVEKKKQYANLVLEMYQPTIDPAKQLELKIIKEQLKDSTLKVGKKRDVKSANEGRSESDEEKKKKVKKKWKKNNMVPEPKVKKEPVKVDWLAEKRELRKGKESNDDEIRWDQSVSDDKIKNQIKKLEKEVRKHEIKLEVANPVNAKGLATTEHVGNMLISSIKGKLAMLEKS